MIICIFIIRPKDVDLEAMEQTRHLLHPGITLPGEIAVKFPARRSFFRPSAELSFHVNDSLANFLELSLFGFDAQLSSSEPPAEQDATSFPLNFSTICIFQHSMSST